MLVGTAASPAPEGGVVEWLIARDGTRFRGARWCPSGATRGTVVVLNGRTEFIEKYFEVIEDLLARGFCVASLDWRGQGLSDRALPNPHKGHVEHFDLYVADLRHAVETFIEPACPAPYRVLAHSMGGNIALRYLGAYPDSFCAAVFSAPMWGIGKAVRPGTFVRALSSLAGALRLHSYYVPGVGGDFDEAERRFEGNELTQHRGRFECTIEKIDAEPRLALGAPTLGWVRQAIVSIDCVHAPGFAEAIGIPIRVCSACDDALVSLDAQAAIVERLPAARQILLEGAKHELLMELDRHRDHVYAAFDEL